MTGDQKEASEVQLWRKRIAAAEQYRNQIAGRYQWRQIVEEYKGHGVSVQDTADIYVPPLNYIFAYIKTEIPALTLREPKLKVNPKNAQSIPAAKILTKALNYIWKVNRFKRENKKNVLDVKLVGHSWFKSGYTGKVEVVEEKNKEYEFISEESFFGYRVPWDAVVFNQDAMDPPFDCAWIAHSVWLPLDEIKKDKTWLHTENLLPSSPQDPEPNKTNTKPNDTDKPKPDVTAKKAKFWEVWDKVGKKKFVISDQSDHYHKKPGDWPCKFRGFPFSYLEINENPDSGYGIPDVWMFLAQIFELQKVRAMQLDHAKRFNRQLLARKGAITGESLENFQEGRTGSIIEADIGPNESVNNVITPIPYPQLQPDVYQVEERIKEDMINVSGQTATERGATQETSTRTFRELAQMDRGAKNRRSDQVDCVEDFIEDIASNQIALLQQLADKPFYVRVDPDDADVITQVLAQRPSALKPGAVTDQTGFTFTKDDIIGEFDIEVVSGSMTPLDSAERMNRLMEILQALPQLGALPGGPVIQALGTGMAEELDMPDMIVAIKAEIQQAMQQRQIAAEKADMQQKLQIADQAAKHQLDAEKVAAKQTEATIKAFEAAKPDSPDAPPAAPEKKGPSESIPFKDLPPDGQIQMAAQAGIHLTHDHIELERMKKQQEMALEEAVKATLKPKPKPAGGASNGK